MRAILYIYYETRHFIDCQRSEEMNPKHTLKEYADALARAGLLTASTLTPAAEGTVIDCLSYDTRSLHGTSLFLCNNF